MAEVFRANREGVAGFARVCVVKRILGHHNEDPSFVDMFINEAKIASKLTHPNIVQVYELGQVDGEFFIAMEYVKGKDLLRVLRELAQTRAADPAVPASLAAYVARETCRALQAAHDHSDGGEARPIIHRDISPQNIMISYDGIVKLVDFGIAKALGAMREETRTGALKGKFAYMAPEQVAGQSPGPSADVFSTGVVLHEMLTGRRLFKGASDYDTLSKVRTMTVPPPSSLNPKVPVELDAIVLKSLERDRNLRYQKASQMARELDLYLSTQRFAMEDMAEFMRGLFPSEPVDPPSNENKTKEYLIRSGSQASRASRSDKRADNTPISGSGVAPRDSYAAARPEVTPSNGSGGRRAVLVAAGLAMIVGIGAIFIFGKKGPAEPTHGALGSIGTEPAPKASKKPDGPEVVQLPQELRVVRVRSEPSRARVYDGPRLIGDAPLDLKLAVDSPGMSITLVHDGRMDLTYLVRPSDAPEITLRLQPVESGSSQLSPPLSGKTRATSVRPGVRPTTPKATPTRPAVPTKNGGKDKPKFEIFDEGNSTPSVRPKVDAIDD
jgi:serine/threonine-protein kinase